MLLARAIARNTLPPTLLFTGPSGVGKWQAALATAQALNCPEPVRTTAADPAEEPDGTGATAFTLDACGTCRSCERIARGLHVDVLAVVPDDKASIKIDVVRDVLSRTGFKPFEGQRRVVVMRHVVGLSPREIATQMGKSEGAVHTLHHRARRAMRTELLRRDTAPIARHPKAVSAVA